MTLKNKWKAIETRPDVIGWAALVSLFLVLIANKIGLLVGYLAFQLADK